MYREKLERPAVSPLKGFCYIFALVTIIIALTTLCNMLFSRFNIPYIDLFMVGVLGILGFFLLRRFTQEYSYILSDDELIFCRSIGMKEWPVLTVGLKSVLFCVKADEAPTNACETVSAAEETYHFSYTRDIHYLTVMFAEVDGKAIRIYLQPSEKLNAMIKAKLRDHGRSL